MPPGSSVERLDEGPAVTEPGQRVDPGVAAGGAEQAQPAQVEDHEGEKQQREHDARSDQGLRLRARGPLLILTTDERHGRIDVVAKRDHGVGDAADRATLTGVRQEGGIVEQELGEAVRRG